MIRQVCASCGNSLEIPDEYAGKSGRCMRCGATIYVDNLPASPPAPQTLAHPKVSPPGLPDSAASKPMMHGDAVVSDTYDQIERLGRLRDSGAISHAEFTTLKAKILDRTGAKPDNHGASPKLSTTRDDGAVIVVNVGNIGPQNAAPGVSANAMDGSGGTYWLPIPSLVLGIFCMLILFDPSPWDKDTIAGFLLFSGAGLTLGIFGVAKQTKGRGMSIAGIIMNSISVLCGLGLLA